MWDNLKLFKLKYHIHYPILNTPTQSTNFENAPNANAKQISKLKDI